MKTLHRAPVAALSLALSLAAALLLPGRPALAAGAPPTPRALVGKVFTSPNPLNPSGDEQTFYNYLKEHDQATIAHSAEGPWSIYLVAFLGQAVGSTQCHVALYELKGKEPARFVDAFGQQVTADQDTLSAHIELSPERFVAGVYELRVTRLVQGKEKVFAKTTITLK